MMAPVLLEAEAVVSALRLLETVVSGERDFIRVSPGALSSVQDPATFLLNGASNLLR